MDAAPREISPYDRAMLLKLLEKHGLPVPTFRIFRPKLRKYPVASSSGRRRYRRRWVRGGRFTSKWPFPVMNIRRPAGASPMDIRWASKKPTVKSTSDLLGRTFRPHRRYGDSEEDDDEGISLSYLRYSRRIEFNLGKVYNVEVRTVLNPRTMLIQYDPEDKLSFIPALVATAIWARKQDAVIHVVVDLLRRTFSDRIIREEPEPIIGMEEPLQELKEVLDLKMNPEMQARLQLARRHFLLIGPPGCGKSLLLRHVCAYISERAVLLYIRGFDQFERWAPIISLITRAVDLSVVLIADEIDEMAQTREAHGSRTFEFLRLMDGVVDMPNVTFLATTNRPDLLDPALLRPERFSPVYSLSWPDEESRKKIWAGFLRRHAPKVHDTNIEKLATLTPHWTGADIRAAVEDSLYKAKGDPAGFSLSQVFETVEKRKVEIERLARYWGGVFKSWQEAAPTTVSMYQ